MSSVMVFKSRVKEREDKTGGFQISQGDCRTEAVKSHAMVEGSGCLLYQ